MGFLVAVRLGKEFHKAHKDEEYQYGTIKKKYGSELGILYDNDAAKGKFNLVKSNWRHLEHVPGAKVKKIMKLIKKQMKKYRLQRYV